MAELSLATLVVIAGLDGDDGFRALAPLRVPRVAHVSPFDLAM
jgi:hypothetical protein